MKVATLLRTRFEHLGNEKLPQLEFEKIRKEKFFRLIRHVKENSPYYRRIINQKGIDPANCDPKDFPVLTKHDVLENFDDMVTDRRITKEGVHRFLSESQNPTDLFKDDFHVVHTTGTSGEVGAFVYSKEDWARGLAHAIRLHKFTFQKVRMAFFGATRGHFAGVSIASTGKSNVQNWFYETRTFEINQPINIVTDHLTEFQPDVLTGYPTALRVLAEKQLEGSLNIQPSSIHCSGEPTTPETRIAIEKAFSVPITNIYMSTEHLFMGIAHPGGERMSLLEDDLIFEFYQDHTLVTNLFNYTLPLIRYRMNDVLTPLSDISRSYPYTYVENLVGRLEHTPVFTNRHGHDDFISPYLFIEFFVKDLERFQMKIESKKFFIFKISLNKKIGSEKKSEVRSQIQEKLRDILDEKEMENVSFEIQETDDLSQGERNGKFDLIVPA